MLPMPVSATPTRRSPITRRAYPICPTRRDTGPGAIFYWNLGRFAEAADDFRQAFKLEPSYSYGLLWAEISAARADTGNVAEFAKAVEKAASDWPRPLLDFYAKGTTREAVMKAAQEGTEIDRRNQQCEANFYLAEWDLARGQADVAKPLLKEASDNCPKNFVEYSAANIELTRLEGKVSK